MKISRNEFLNTIPDGRKDWLRMRLSKLIALNRECWEFQGTKDKKGYGHIWFNGRIFHAHRAAYALWAGKLEEGLTLDHLCRNAGCINPGHLEQVSSGENNLRSNSPSAENAHKAYCLRGHVLPSPNHRGHRNCQACIQLSPSRERWNKKRRIMRAAKRLAKAESALAELRRKEWPV